MNPLTIPFRVVETTYRPVPNPLIRDVEDSEKPWPYCWKIELVNVDEHLLTSSISLNVWGSQKCPLKVGVLYKAAFKEVREKKETK